LITLTKPTWQMLERLPVAVSKSIAVKDLWGIKV
jgi:hypothetical protein